MGKVLLAVGARSPALHPLPGAVLREPDYLIPFGIPGYTFAEQYQKWKKKIQKNHPDIKESSGREWNPEKDYGL